MKIALLSFLFGLLGIACLGQSMTNWSLTSATTTFEYPSGTPVDNSDGTNPADPGTESGARNLPFDFWYMGTRYTQVNFNNFGTVALGATANDTKVNTAGAGAGLENDATGRPFLAPLWDNIEIDDGNSGLVEGVYDHTSGYTADEKYHVSWVGMEWSQSESTGSISFSCILHESGEIEYTYTRESGGSPSSPSASIGMTASGTGSGNFISVNGSEAISTTTDTDSRTGSDMTNLGASSDASYLFTPTSKCTAPAITAATAASSTQIDLTWSDNSSDELNFAVYYSTDPNVPLASANYFSTEAAGATSKSVTGLDPCTKYYFKILAIKESYTASVIVSETTSVADGANYYVNDGTDDGADDPYTTAVGSGANTGTSAGSPKLTIGSIISGNVLTDGDTVFVDSGTFSEDVTITTADDGSNGCGVVFIGVDSSKTIISGTSIPLTLSDVDYVTVKNFKIMNNGVADDAVEMNGGNHTILANCWIINGQGGAESAIDMGPGGSGSTYNEIHDCYIDAGIGAGIDMDGDVSPSKPHTYGAYYDNKIFSSGAGIGISIDNADNNEFYRNRIYDCSKGITFPSSDGGSYYNKISNNYISNVTNGIYHDIASSSYINEASFNSFYTTQNGIWFDESNGADEWTVKNNIFYSTGSSTYGAIHLDGTEKMASCDCNMYYVPSGARCGRTGGGTYTSIANWQGVSHTDDGSDDANSISADPLYEAPASNNLNLQTTSSAIGQGCYDADFQSDIYNTVRQNPPTIGAYDKASSAVLPVELGHFLVWPDGGKVNLEWLTYSERNNDYFEVQHSINNKQFVTIDKKYGQGTTPYGATYEANHHRPAQGVNYYRIVQHDYDGKTFTYPVRAVKFGSSNMEFITYQNGQITGLADGKYTITIVDQLGRTTSTISVSNSPTLDLSSTLDQLDSRLVIIAVYDEELHRRKTIKVVR